MYCQNCGAVIEIDAEFCGNCGAKQDGSSSSEQSKTTNQQPNEKVEYVKSFFKNNLGKIISAISGCNVPHILDWKVAV